MKRTKTLALWTLLAANAVLLVAFVARLSTGGVAVAQQEPAQATNRDDYLMEPGEINGGTNAIVYVIDETTHQLSSMSYDDSEHRLSTMPPRNMERDFESVGSNTRRGRR